MAGVPGIPLKYLSKMGTYTVNIHGVKVTVHTADSDAAKVQHITDFYSYIKHNTNTSHKLVVVDVKKSEKAKGKSFLVLYSCGRCVILPGPNSYGYGQYPQSTVNFINDPNICFVEVARQPQPIYFGFNLLESVPLCELAVRVLKKPNLIKSNLHDIAKEVGVVKYEGSATGSAGVVEAALAVGVLKKPYLNKYNLRDLEVGVVKYDGSATRCADVVEAALAVRVLKKPYLNKYNLRDFEVGVVKHEDSATGSAGVVEAALYQPLVFTDDQLRIVISAAVACYQIAYKLLSSL